MRITVDVPDDKIRELLELTGEKKMSPAVSKAVIEYIRRMKSSELGALIKAGAFTVKD